MHSENLIGVTRQAHDMLEPDGSERGVSVTRNGNANVNGVFIPKCCRQTLYKALRMHLFEVYQRLASQRECRILEGHVLSGRVHMLISIPPKYVVFQMIG